MPSASLSLAELLADLSLVTDLGVGQSPEAALRTCLLAKAMRQARPHRSAVPPERAAGVLRQESARGRLDRRPSAQCWSPPADDVP